MSSEVVSPRIFGRRMWVWASLLVYGTDHGTTWHCGVMRRLLWPLCQRFTGHRQAAGERGYGGGGMVDVFCAYCRYPWQVPASEMPSAQRLVDLFHSETPR